MKKLYQLTEYLDDKYSPFLLLIPVLPVFFLF